MAEYQTRVARVCSRLNAERANYVVVGATAMQLWGTSRATRDVDILIEPTVANATRVLQALATLGFGFASEHSPEDVALRPVTMIGDMPNVDILTRAWNLTWDVACRSITTFDVEGVSVPAASLEHLVESKQTGRLQDLADIDLLEALKRERGE